ncbi:hypothetical protein B0A48_04315 [Cryoendolithus antarcticus]|uniref:F-box domain-containing protein n=1 Tax=Cryoendolithus antarcticus TaxID=1507870 RepID=A0A1V8TF09_9PEZI|nr:hypothetical protein B0A48_04315 [Cryoendolithus antarcticus]
MPTSSIDRLTTLAPELLHSIIELLSAREICSIRRVNRGLKDYVDRYESTLASLTIAHHRKKICARVAWLLDLKDLDLIDILHRYTSYYGEIGLHSPAEHERILQHLLRLTLDQKFPALDGMGRMRMGVDVLNFWLLFTISHEWVHSRWPPSEPSTPEAYEEMMHIWTRLESRKTALGDPISNVEYVRARIQDSALLQGPRYAGNYGVPRYPISARQCLPLPLYLEGSELAGRCEALLYRALGFPVLSGGLGYCVKSEPMQSMVYEVLTQAGKGRLLMRSRLRQTALWEEVFVF